jgi:hypothetical protein
LQAAELFPAFWKISDAGCGQSRRAVRGRLAARSATQGRPENKSNKNVRFGKEADI